MMEHEQLMTVEESYVERRQLFKDIWETAMHMDEKDGEILNKPKVIKTLRLSEVDRSAGRKKKQRIKNLRAVCKKILEFCDKQDADDIFYEQIDSSVVTANNETYEQNSSAVINDSNSVIYEIVTEEGSSQIIENAQTHQLDSMGGPLLQQTDIFVVLKAILDNQEKIIKKISELSVQLEESQRNQEPFVTTLSQAKGMQTKRILIKPIDDIQGLQQLDMELSTAEGFENLQEKYSILCSVQPGNGTNCAYRLLDALFTKDFLCKCSWTGGSRNADVKIGFKGYKNIINFFFAVVNSWDNTYSMENNEDFFKTVLRNALKRKDSKNVRLSAPKKRVKKDKKIKNDNGNENKGKEGNANESKNDNENDSNDNNEHVPENEVLLDNAAPQSGKNYQEEEEDEGSLC